MTTATILPDSLATEQSIVRALKRGGPKAVYHMPPMYRREESGKGGAVRMRHWHARIDGSGALTLRYGIVGEGYHLTETVTRFPSAAAAVADAVKRLRKRVEHRYWRHFSFFDRGEFAPPPAEQEGEPAYPVLVQPRMPGAECVAWWDAVAHCVQLYAPNSGLFCDDDYRLGTIRRCLERIMRVAPSISLIGTLYSPVLQRRSAQALFNDTEAPQLYFYVHDLHCAEAPGQPRHERLERLHTVLRLQRSLDQPDERVFAAPSVVAHTRAEAAMHADLYRKSGFAHIRKSALDASHAPTFRGYRL